MLETHFTQFAIIIIIINFYFENEMRIMLKLRYVNCHLINNKKKVQRV
jgi:hypothetical protein